MNIIFKVFLILHIFGGSVGLLTGMLNMIRKKGDKNHKLVGRVFLISMLTSGISSLILASIHTNYFLFMVGVFTLYMVGSGQLYLKGYNNTTSKSIEWTITILMLLAGILFVGFGVLALAKTNLFGLVFVTFGCLVLLFVRQDFKNHKGQSAIKNYGLVAHLQRMTGGFIATLTAFLVVNAKYFPEQIPSFLYWLLPTIVLTPLIIKWSRKYEVKKK
jgi:uncharacterized membrane protein